MDVVIVPSSLPEQSSKRDEKIMCCFITYAANTLSINKGYKRKRMLGEAGCGKEEGIPGLAGPPFRSYSPPEHQVLPLIPSEGHS